MQLPLYNLKVSKEEEWQLVGKELSTFFGKKLFWVCWRYPMIRIKDSFQAAQKENDRDLSHFLQRIKT